MTEPLPIPDEAVKAALAKRAYLLADRPDPMVLSNETLTRKMLEAAAPAIAKAWGAFECEPLRIELDKPPDAFFDEHDLAVIRQYQECPESRMDDGSHSAGCEDGDRCVWCGAR